MISPDTKEVPGTPAVLSASSSPQLFERRSAIASYFLALLLGLYVCHYLLPAKAVLARDIRVRPVYEYDAAMNVYGQRYFTKDAWRWPPLQVKTLGAPAGTNVGFMDGIPLAELVVKLFRRFLPPDFHSVYLWLALCWVAQPMTAVFALRSAGERRLLPNLAIAIIAVSMPTLLFRFVHSSLCSHFVLLIALGLYFRITRHARLGTVIGADALMLAALLINPYIMEMTIAVLVAAPISLLVRRDRRCIPVAAGIGGGVVVTAIVALFLGYGHAVPIGGFGMFTMNLLSPIYPATAFAGQFVDATGGQYEGFQYLGVGVILTLLVADFCLNMSDRLALLRRHAGLVFSCVVLTCLALSTKVYAGHRLILDLPTPSFLLELRSSGRLFWPVAYALVITGIVIVCRKLPPRWAFVTVLVFASLQYVESNPMRQEVRRVIRTRRGYTVDTVLLRSLLATHSQLNVWPKFGCGADVTIPAFSDLYLLASEVAIPVNMSYVGRFTKLPDCHLPEFPIAVGQNELWVFVPQWNPGMVVAVEDWNNICRQSGVLVLCAQDLRGRTDLQLPNVPLLPLGTKLSTASDGPGDQWLASGWYNPEPWGIWSKDSVADIAVSLPEADNKPLIFTATAQAFAAHPATSQQVTVLADGHQVATWDVKEDAPADYTAIIPPRSTSAESILLQFHIEHPASPTEQGRGADDRKLGFGLVAFRFDEQEIHQPRSQRVRAQR
jgi:hypothetical protein